jgi:uncharacterized membrane protein
MESTDRGVSTATGDAVKWVLKRNCSMTPKQSLGAYGGLCVVLLGVAGGFWSQGAHWVMPFAWLEVLALGAAVAWYVRHATDRETVVLDADRLTVELQLAGRLQSVAFDRRAVRVQPHDGRRSLIQLAGNGKLAEIGRFVRPELRPGLADELRSVLRSGSLPPVRETV